MRENFKTLMNKGKWLGNTLFTIILIVLIIAIYISINIWLTDQNIPDIDLTKEQLYSLSQESIDKIASVNKKTNIILYGMENYSKVADMANLYTKQNNNITYEVLSDTSTRPDLVTEYGLGSSVTSLIIIETENRKKAVTISDLYTYDTTTYQEIDTTEQSLTNAILDVNLDKNPKIYFVTNHASYAGFYSLAATYLENEANEVEDLDIVTKGGIPDDCDVLVITTLKEDFTDFETEQILSYINNGGSLMLLADPNFGTVTLNNLNKILATYGASVSDGIVYETDDNYKLSGYPDAIIPNISYDSEITRYIATGGAVTFIGAGIINFQSDEELANLGVEVQNLATASETSFLRMNYEEYSLQRVDGDQDSAGKPIASLVTKKITGENGETKESKLILIVNSIFASDIPITLYGANSNSSAQYFGISFYNNKDLVVNSISYLANRTDNLTIRKDTGTVYTFTATEKEQNIIKAIIIALPIVVIVFGIVVWQIRRRKK